MSWPWELVAPLAVSMQSGRSTATPGPWLYLQGDNIWAVAVGLPTLRPHSFRARHHLSVPRQIIGLCQICPNSLTPPPTPPKDFPPLTDKSWEVALCSLWKKNEPGASRIGVAPGSTHPCPCCEWASGGYPAGGVTPFSITAPRGSRPLRPSLFRFRNSLGGNSR